MAMLGVFNRIKGLFTVDEIVAGLQDFLPPWRQKMIPINRMVIEAVMGIDLEEYRVSTAS
jgi:hypothetical protein